MYGYSPLATEALAGWEEAETRLILLDTALDLFFSNGNLAVAGGKIDTITGTSFVAYGDAGLPNRVYETAYFRDYLGELLYIIEQIIASDHTECNTAFNDVITNMISVSGESSSFSSVLMYVLDELSSSVISSAISSPTIIEEFITTGSPCSAGSTIHCFLDAFFNLKESARISYIEALISGLSVSENINSSASRISFIIDSLVLSEYVESKHDATVIVASAMVLTDVLTSGKGASLLDETILTALVNDRILGYIELIEDVYLEDTPELSIKIFPISKENIDVSETTLSSALFQSLANDGISFYTSFNLSDEDQYIFSGWAMNAKTFTATEYTNYPFNSFAKIENNYYGANGSGLYRLDGDLDDGSKIESIATLGVTDFNESRSKRMRSAHLGLRSDGNVILKVMSDNNKVSYFTLSDLSEKLTRNKVSIGRDHLSTYWQFSLMNKDGSDFELDSMIFIPIVLNRRG